MCDPVRPAFAGRFLLLSTLPRLFRFCFRKKSAKVAKVFLHLPLTEMSAMKNARTKIA